MIATPDHVRFATLYGFRPDFCEGGDPESKGIVENLVGYAKSDLVVPAEWSEFASLSKSARSSTNYGDVIVRAEGTATTQDEPYPS